MSPVMSSTRRSKVELPRADNVALKAQEMAKANNEKQSHTYRLEEHRGSCRAFDNCRHTLF